MWIDTFREMRIYRYGISIESHVRGGMFCAKADSLDDGLISQTSTARIGRRKKNHISAWCTFHQFPSALTDHNRTSNTNIGGAILIYAIHRRTYNIIRERPRNFSASARIPFCGSTRPISHIIRPSIDSYVDTLLRFSGKTRARLVTLQSESQRRWLRNRNRTRLYEACWCIVRMYCQKRREEKLTKSNGGNQIDSEDPSVLRLTDWRYLTSNLTGNWMLFLYSLWFFRLSHYLFT